MLHQWVSFCFGMKSQLYASFLSCQIAPFFFFCHRLLETITSLS